MVKTIVFNLSKKNCAWLKSKNYWTPYQICLVSKLQTRCELFAQKITTLFYQIRGFSKLQTSHQLFAPNIATLSYQIRGISKLQTRCELFAPNIATLSYHIRRFLKLQTRCEILFCTTFAPLPTKFETFQKTKKVKKIPDLLAKLLTTQTSILSVEIQDFFQVFKSI